jgi:hypothetical protein
MSHNKQAKRSAGLGRPYSSIWRFVNASPACLPPRLRSFAINAISSFALPGAPRGEP